MPKIHLLEVYISVAFNTLRNSCNYNDYQFKNIFIGLERNITLIDSLHFSVTLSPWQPVIYFLFRFAYSRHFI